MRGALSRLHFGELLQAVGVGLPGCGARGRDASIVVEVDAPGFVGVPTVIECGGFGGRHPFDVNRMVGVVDGRRVCHAERHVGPIEDCVVALAHALQAVREKQLSYFAF